MDPSLIQANVQKKKWNHPATPLNDPHQNWNSKRTELLNTVHKQINKKAHPPTIHISFDFHQSKCFLFIFRRVVKEKLFHLRRGRIDHYKFSGSLVNLLDRIGGSSVGMPLFFISHSVLSLTPTLSLSSEKMKVNQHFVNLVNNDFSTSCPH